MGVLLVLAHRLDADEGQILTGAWNLFHGARLYEDFFEFIGPGSFYWVAGFFRVLGPSYASAIAASASLLLVGIWAFHASARLVIDVPRVRWGASLLWVLLIATPPFINHNTYSSLLATVVAWCLLRILPRRGADGGVAPARSNVWLAAVAGVLSGTTLYVLQPKGLALIGVGVVTLVVSDLLLNPRPGRSLRRLLLLPYLAGLAVVILGGAMAWGMAPFAALATVARGNLAMNHAALSHSYLPLGVALGLALLAGAACYRGGHLDRRITFLLALQVGLWASTAHLPDAWHLAVNSFPLLLVLGHLADRPFNRASPGLWTRSVSVLFVAVAGLGVGGALVRNLEDTRGTAEWLTELRSTLGGEDFFAFTFLPSFYLELGVPNPYFNSVLYEGSHPTSHFHRNVALLETYRPRYVIADYSSVAKYGHSRDNPVDEFIRARYRPVRALPHAGGALEIWELAPGGGARR
jgi:hypothetical protein